MGKIERQKYAFFHSMATVRYRRNSIATLTREYGSIASEHFEKAGILWKTYRERLGVSIVPFTHEEIENWLPPDTSQTYP
jgi:hypothetical protein